MAKPTRWDAGNRIYFRVIYTLFIDRTCALVEGFIAPNSLVSLFIRDPLSFRRKVIDDGTVVYKWVGKSAETGKPDPSILPDLAPVKRALARERPRL